MNTKNFILCCAAALIVIGVVKPDFSQLVHNTNHSNNNINVVVEKPSDAQILGDCQRVIDSLKADSDRKIDGLKLASLYSDMATLISLDGEDTVIKNTEEIRQANKLVGSMLKLDIKGKYPKLAQSAEALIVASIGDDSVLLDSSLRQKAADGFKALAWACYQGAK